MKFTPTLNHFYIDLFYTENSWILYLGQYKKKKKNTSTCSLQVTTDVSPGYILMKSLWPDGEKQLATIWVCAQQALVPHSSEGGAMQPWDDKKTLSHFLDKVWNYP